MKNYLKLFLVLCLCFLTQRALALTTNQISWNTTNIESGTSAYSAIYDKNGKYVPGTWTCGSCTISVVGTPSNGTYTILNFSSNANEFLDQNTIGIARSDPNYASGFDGMYTDTRPNLMSGINNGIMALGQDVGHGLPPVMAVSAGLISVNELRKYVRRWVGGKDTNTTVMVSTDPQRGGFKSKGGDRF